jgi:hypothetical protein
MAPSLGELKLTVQLYRLGSLSIEAHVHVEHRR